MIQTVFDPETSSHFVTGAYERPLGTDGLKAIVTGNYVTSKPGAAGRTSTCRPTR